MNVAKWISAVVAVLFIGLGIYPLLLALRASMSDLALVVSGTAILFGRSWGDYIAYLAAFSCLLPPQRISLIPVPYSLGQFFWLNAGMEPELFNVLINFLFASALGWSHYVLQKTHQLDRPMSPTTRRTTTRAALLVSLALILLPAVNFLYQLVIDPPRPGGPADPGGGLHAFYALYLGWPFVLAGLIGTGICLVIRQSPRRERSNEGGEEI